MKILFIVSAILGILSCTNSTREMKASTDESLIRAAREVSNQAIQNKDTSALSSVWTEDYHVVTSRNFEVSGRIANRDRFANEFSSKPDVIYIRTPDDVQVFNKWNMASERGTWLGRWTEKGEKVELKGSYFAKWHKIDGRWLIRAEIFVPLSCSGGEFCKKTPI